jgi:hypothetical protein
MRVKNNKGMIASQLFTYMLGIIVISVTVLIGYKVIATFGNISPQINDFKLDVEVRIDDVANEYGSFKRERIPLTSKIKVVCFANSDIIDDPENRIAEVKPDDLKEFETYLPTKAYGSIYDSLESGVQANVFIVTNKNMEEAFYINDLSITKHDKTGPTVECIQNMKGINFALNGWGDYAEITASCGDGVDCLVGTCDTTHEKNLCEY